jgi:hypothetical protein
MMESGNNNNNDISMNNCENENVNIAQSDETKKKEIQQLQNKIPELKNLKLDHCQLGNYIDFLDGLRTWIYGRIIEKDEHMIKVCFEGFNRSDEVNI